MKDLSIIQEYTICAVNEKGKFPALSTEKAVCFVAAGILELRLEKCISIDGKKLDITGELPANRQYLKPLYNLIAQKAPVKLERVVEAYNFCLTNKHSARLGRTSSTVRKIILAMDLVSPAPRSAPERINWDD